MIDDKKIELSDESSTSVSDVSEEPAKNPNMKWYVVHTHTGMENRAKKNLEERIIKQGLEDKFGRILLPTETVESFKNQQKKIQSRKCLPGYLIIEMEMSELTSQLVRGTQKISGFVGGSKLPLPISQKEAERMMELSLGVTKTIVSVEFNEGENIKVIDGPFANFQGTIEEVKTDKKKLRVLVSIFGRSTPVDLDFNQVEKIG